MEDNSVSSMKPQMVFLWTVLSFQLKPFCSQPYSSCIPSRRAHHLEAVHRTVPSRHILMADKKRINQLAIWKWNQDHENGDLRISPGEIRKLGSKTMKMVAMQIKILPINSRRRPNHSFDALLWKSICRLALTLSTFPWKKLSSFLKQRTVMIPDMVSEKWWRIGALVIELSLVSSREDAM